MNERIRELWDKAAEDTAAFPSGQNNSWQTQVNFMDKFAELIVKECVNIALEQKKRVEDQEVFNPHDASWNRAKIQQSQRIVDRINEHFGVEE